MIGKALAFFGKAKGKTAEVISLIKMGVGLVLNQIKLYLIIGLTSVFGIIYLAALVYIILNGNISQTNSELTKSNYKTRGSDLSSYDETKDDYPQYLQNDERWKNEKLSDGNLISESGSGLCAIAGVLSKLSGRQLTPIDIKDEIPIEANSNNTGEIAIEAAKCFGYNFQIGLGNFQYNTILEELAKNTDFYVLAQIDGQTFYMANSGKDNKPIKIVNSRTEKNGTTKKFFSGDTTIEDIQNEDISVIGYFDGTKIS